MKRLALFFAALLAVIPLLATPDVAGSKDHPLLTRMQSTFIEKYRTNPFSSFSFKVAKGKETPVEG